MVFQGIFCLPFGVFWVIVLFWRIHRIFGILVVPEKAFKGVHVGYTFPLGYG